MKGHMDSTLTTVCLSDEHSLKNESEHKWSERLWRRSKGYRDAY